MGTKVLIWGIGKEFYSLYNLLMLHEATGELEIVGYVSRDTTVRCFFGGGGKDVLPPEEIEKVEFEYIIVATNAYYKEIVEYGVKVLLIERKKFINGKVLKIPYFDWGKYIKIYNADISIISETCMGGGISNALGLPFCSPFVNVRVGLESDDYFKLINNLDYFMECAPMENPNLKYTDYNWAGWEARIDFPRLWYDDILIHGFHYKCQEEFFNTWEKRRERYCKENKFIFKILYSYEDVERFEQIEYKRKLGFFYKKIDREKIISLYSNEICGKYAYSYAGYLFDLVSSGDIFTHVDFFDLLNVN